MSISLVLGLSLKFLLPCQGMDISEKSPLFSSKNQSPATLLYNSGTSYLQDNSDPQNLKKAFNALKQAADLGHKEAQYYVGFLYENGTGVGKDPYWAGLYYKKSATQGDRLAQNNLASLYERGLGVSQNYEQAAHLYGQSSAQGSVNASLNLAHLWEQGVVKGKNITDALHCYQKMADQGNARAHYHLGVLYLKGNGVEQNLNLAISNFKIAAKQGNARAQAELAYMGITKTPIRTDNENRLDRSFALLKANTPTNEAKVERTIALNFLKNQASQGNATAQYMVGCVYNYRWGIESNKEIIKDKHIAINHYFLAASQGHHKAMDDLWELDSYKAQRASMNLAHNGNESERTHFREMIDFSLIPVLDQQTQKECENTIHLFLSPLMTIDASYIAMGTWAEGNLAHNLFSNPSYGEIFKYTENPYMAQISKEISQWLETVIKSVNLLLEPGTLLSCIDRVKCVDREPGYLPKVFLNDTCYSCFNSRFLKVSGTLSLNFLEEKVNELRNLLKTGLTIIQKATNTKKLIKMIKAYELLEHNESLCSFLNCYIIHQQTIDDQAKQEVFFNELHGFFQESYKQVDAHLSLIQKAQEEFPILVEKTTDYRNDLFVRYIGLR